MNYKDFDLFPEEIPSPEELFQIDLGDAAAPEPAKEMPPAAFAASAEVPIEDTGAAKSPSADGNVSAKPPSADKNGFAKSQAADVNGFAKSQAADVNVSAKLQSADGKEQAEPRSADGDVQKKRKNASGKTKPRRRGIKIFTAGFVILILVVALFITNMDKFHLHCYCMMTDSMGDTIPKGSVVFAYEVPVDELVVGDVITYINSQGVSVTHQIISEIYDYNESGSRAFYTKGTENDTIDEDAVTYDMIKGKVVIYIPYIARPFIK